MSIVGLNVTSVLSFFYPDRAVLLAGGNVVNQARIEVVTTNAGTENGYVDGSLECNDGGDDQITLVFSATAPTSVEAGKRVSVPYQVESTFFIRMTDALEAGEKLEDSFIGWDFYCALKGYDRHGEVVVTMNRRRLIVEPSQDRKKILMYFTAVR